MLNELVNGLSGVTGYIRYDSADFYMVQMLIVLLGFIFICILYLGFVSLVKGSKSNQYRKLLVDMYVVGVIKKLAKEDNVDLIKELQEYNKIIKREKLNTKGLDSVIEEELKEKVADVQDEKLK